MSPSSRSPRPPNDKRYSNPNAKDRLSHPNGCRAPRPIFDSEADAKAALKKANVPPATADEIVKQNTKSQIDGLRAAEAILALLALIALHSPEASRPSNPAPKPIPDHPRHSRLDHPHYCLGLTGQA